MRYSEDEDDEAGSFRTIEDVYKRIEELTGTKISSEEDVEALRSALKEKNDDTFILIYEIEEIPRGGSSSHTLFPWGDMSDWEIEEVDDDDIPEETSEMTSMQSMFLLRGETTLDLSSFDTSKVVNMSLMFGYCSDLTTLDLSSFDTSKVVNMSGMFEGCSALSTLNLSSFDTSNVTNMREMFSDCTELTTLDLSSFDTSKVTDMEAMFVGCDSLKTVIMRNCSAATIKKIKSKLPEGVEIIQ
ncbi:BspA family leucine-rich repeat surface protein [Barnesiella sp. WM24]|nr:BspA family leucine-rich repeat surface protein [Barnesiella sp. WM24]